jgi:hypothetical protein
MMRKGRIAVSRGRAAVGGAAFFGAPYYSDCIDWRENIRILRVGRREKCLMRDMLEAGECYGMVGKEREGV